MPGGGSLFSPVRTEVPPEQGLRVNADRQARVKQQWQRAERRGVALGEVRERLRDTLAGILLRHLLYDDHAGRRSRRKAGL